MRAITCLSTCVLLPLLGITNGTAFPEPSDPSLTHALGSVYYVDFTRDDRGACVNYQYQIEAAYSQTIEALYNAQNAVRAMRKPRPDMNADLKAYNDWTMISPALLDMFGVKVSKDTGAVDGSDLDLIHQIYRHMIEQHTVVKSSRTKNFLLMCGDGWLERVAVGNADPTDRERKRTVGKNPEAQKAWDRPGVPVGGKAAGIYYSWIKFRRRRSQRIWLDTLVGPTPAHPICTVPTSIAETWENDNIITFCPIAYQDPSWSMTTSAFSHGNPKMMPGDSIDKMEKTIAATWLHEIGHLTLRLKDHDNVESSKGKDGIFGWSDSYDLARAERNLALDSAENFAIFAMAMYLEESWWIGSKGEAVPRDPRHHGLQEKANRVSGRQASRCYSRNLQK